MCLVVHKYEGIFFIHLDTLPAGVGLAGLHHGGRGGGSGYRSHRGRFAQNGTGRNRQHTLQTLARVAPPYQHLRLVVVRRAAGHVRFAIFQE